MLVRYDVRQRMQVHIVLMEVHGIRQVQYHLVHRQVNHEHEQRQRM